MATILFCCARIEMETPEAVGIFAHIYTTVVHPAQNAKFKQESGHDLGAYEISEQKVEDGLATAQKDCSGK